MVRHRFHATFALGHELSDRSQVFLGDVDSHALHRFRAHAINSLGDDLRLTNGQLETFTAHLLDKDRQSKLTTPLNFPSIGTFGGKHAQRNVTNEFAIKSVLHLACGDLCSLDAAGHGRGVNSNSHGDRGIINGDQRQGTRVIEVDQRLTDGDVFNTCDCNDIAGFGTFGRDSLKTFGTEQLGDANGLNASIVASKSHGFTLAQGSVVDTQQGESSQEWRGVQVRHVSLKGCAIFVLGTRNAVKNRLEEGLEVLGGDIAVAGVGERGLSGLRRGVNNRNVEQGIHICVNAFAHQIFGQSKKKVLGLRDNLFDTGIGAVNLIDDNDDGKLCLKSLTQYEAGLRERAFGRVNQQNDSVNHGQASFNLATKIGVPGGIDDVDNHAAFEAQFLGGGTTVVNRSVLGQDRNALFALQITGVHDALAGFFNRIALIECA